MRTVEPHAVTILACDNPEASCLISCSHRSPTWQLVDLCGKARRDEPTARRVWEPVGITYPRILLGLIVNDFLLTFARRREWGSTRAIELMRSTDESCERGIHGPASGDLRSRRQRPLSDWNLVLPGSVAQLYRASGGTCPSSEEKEKPLRAIIGQHFSGFYTEEDRAPYRLARAGNQRCHLAFDTEDATIDQP
jgi:hypothetical protein